MDDVEVTARHFRNIFKSVLHNLLESLANNHPYGLYESRHRISAELP